eukprot:GILJ01005764.1.p1 GENE.GILJ01005764.1~~GILJ01005764.1.p1  ORF type:complete len:580 (-),score=14.78 GILJ01005764.1:69-1808(-)
MGFREELVVGDCERWLCAICRDVVQDAVETPCEHIYCRECVASLPKCECPVCRQAFHPAQIKAPHRLVREHLAGLKLRCVHWTEGCQSEMPLSHAAIVEHDEQCLFADVGCDSVMPDGERCPVRVRRSELQGHLFDCLFFNIGCGNVGCEEFVARKDAQTHISRCAYHQLTCSRCGGSFLRQEAAWHDVTCPEVLTSCQHQGCEVTVRRKDLLSHSGECGFGIVKCDRCGANHMKQVSNSHDCVVYLKQQNDTLVYNMEMLHQQVQSLQSTIATLAGEQRQSHHSLKLEIASRLFAECEAVWEKFTVQSGPAHGPSSANFDGANCKGQRITDSKLLLPCRTFTYDAGCTSLSLRNVDLSPAQVQTIADAIRAKAARSAPAFASNVKGDVSVDIRNAKLGDEGVSALAPALSISQLPLRRLILSGNCISTRGVQLLAEMMGELHYLDLSSNIIDDAGAEVIAESFRKHGAKVSVQPLRNRDPRSILLALNDFSSRAEGRDARSHNRGFRRDSTKVYLDLSGNSFGLEGLVALVNAFRERNDEFELQLSSFRNRIVVPKEHPINTVIQEVRRSMPNCRIDF